MRAALAALVLSGCYDFDHFSKSPFDLASADVAPRADLVTGNSCTTYTFANGVPPGLQLVNASSATIDWAAGALHVVDAGGADHDFGVSNLAAVRVEEVQPRSGQVQVTAIMRGTIDAQQQLIGAYLDAGSTYYKAEVTYANATFSNRASVFTYQSGMSPWFGGAPQTVIPASYSIAVTSPSAATSSYTFTIDGSAYTYTTQVASAYVAGAFFGTCCSNAPPLDAYLDSLKVCELE